MHKPNWQPTKAEYWKHLPAPARPWPDEVSIFEEYVREKKEQGQHDVLVLGSTVEFRSMLHRLRMKVHIVDFSRDFYTILSKQPMEYTGEETFYEQDWITMDPGKRFDLILGDWVPGVLHTKDYDRFFQNIRKHLKNDGLFIARMCLRPDRSVVDLAKVASRHMKEYASKYSFYETSMQYVYGYRVDPQTSMWNIGEARKALAAVCEAGLLEAGDCDFMRKALEIEKEASASIMVREDMEKELEKYFSIVAVRYGGTPSASWYPIYALSLPEKRATFDIQGSDPR